MVILYVWCQDEWDLSTVKPDVICLASDTGGIPRYSYHYVDNPHINICIYIYIYIYIKTNLMKNDSM